MQQGILLFTANSSPDDFETWRACFQRKYKYAEQGKLTLMQIPLRSCVMAEGDAFLAVSKIRKKMGH
jgi:hypothetical protein